MTMATESPFLRVISKRFVGIKALHFLVKTGFRYNRYNKLQGFSFLLGGAKRECTTCAYCNLISAYRGDCFYHSQPRPFVTFDLLL